MHNLKIEKKLKSSKILQDLKNKRKQVNTVSVCPSSDRNYLIKKKKQKNATRQKNFYVNYCNNQSCLSSLGKDSLVTIKSKCES